MVLTIGECLVADVGNIHALWRVSQVESRQSKESAPYQAALMPEVVSGQPA